MRQDRNGVRTAADLERKYDFSGMQKAYRLNKTGLNKTNAEIENFVRSVLGTMGTLQVQTDGRVDTYYYAGVPSLSNVPASSWTAEEYPDKDGDLYYDTETGNTYRFTYYESLGTAEWVLTDNSASPALSIANATGDTADNKRSVFLEQPTPPYSNGDLWIKDGELYVCQVSKAAGETYAEKDFIAYGKYTEGTSAEQIADQLRVVYGTVLTVKENADSFVVTLNNTTKAVDSLGEDVVTLEEKYSEFTLTAENLSFRLSETDAKAEDAKKTATNFLGYDATNGLLVGNKQSGSWSGYRTQILPTSFNILDESGVTLASYGSDVVRLGCKSYDSTIYMCNNIAAINATDTDSGLNVFKIKSNGTASIESAYSFTLKSVGSSSDYYSSIKGVCPPGSPYIRMTNSDGSVLGHFDVGRTSISMYSSKYGANWYLGFAGNNSDGTLVWSTGGTNHTDGLAIGASSGNLLWKGNKVLDVTGGTLTGGLTAPHSRFYGTYTSTASSRFSNSALEIRENGLVAGAQSDIGYAPTIGFHWSSRIASTLAFGSDGVFYFRKQDGVTRASIDANVVGNADTATKATQDGSGNTITSTYAKLASDNNLLAHGNEFTFLSAAKSGTVWLNYRTANGSCDGTVTGYFFGNGGGRYQSVTLYAGTFSGNATSASKLNINGTMGNAQRPVYFVDGVPKLCDAEFVRHSSPDGNSHAITLGWTGSAISVTIDGTKTGTLNVTWS